MPSCAFCGWGDRWIKTCLAEDGSHLRVCDQCWEALRLVIVPGDAVVTARCILCGEYGNPREFAEVNPGGRKKKFIEVARSKLEQMQCTEASSRPERD